MFIGTRRRKSAGKNRNISGDLQPIDMDPGSVIPVPDRVRDDGPGTGVTGTEGTRIRPTLIYSEKPERMQHGPHRLTAPRQSFAMIPSMVFMTFSRLYPRMQIPRRSSSG
jgi:hypothetical protein